MDGHGGGPRALVIPFGVPDGGKGLGLGLASLVHAFARIGDSEVALAQIRSHGSDGGITGIVEAFVTGAQWRAMPGAEDTPLQVATVLTGAFEPPRDGRGTFTVLAFDAKTGEARAKCEVVLDAEGAGRSIVTTLASLCSRVGGDVGALRGLESLGWDALESVLLAETWRVRALSGAYPSGGAAALAHLGRAVGEAKDASFPADRLATMALELARPSHSSGADGTRSTEAALRTLDAAREDARTNASLEAAGAALCLRLGRPRDAIVRAERAIERDAARAFSHALLAEAKRVSGDLEGAYAAITVAAALDETDPHVRNERAAVLVATGDVLAAQVEWGKLLASQPLHLPAFANLASIALERGDTTLAQSLVDHALAVRGNAPLEMLRHAVSIALRAEVASVARGARVESLCRTITERDPSDSAFLLVLARALAEMGERASAIARLDALEQSSKGTAIAAEAARVRVHVRDPLAGAAIDAAIRAASEGGQDPAALDAMATRARRLGDAHESWIAHAAAAMAERRLGRLDRARADAWRALALAPSAPLAHVEMALAFLASKDAASAVAHARRAVNLDPSPARAHAVLADALLASGDPTQARRSVLHALVLAPNDAQIVALRERIERKGARTPTSWIDRLLKR